MNSVNVIGGGPIGLQTAIKLRHYQIPVTIIERNSDIIRSISCGGLISVDGVRQAKLDIEEYIQNKIYGARIFSPDNTCLTIRRSEPVAYVINRVDWQTNLYKKARDMGIRIFLDSTFTGRENGHICILQKGEKIKLPGDILIGADGPKSRVRNSLGIKIPRQAFVHTCQATVRGEFDTEYVQVYFTRYSKIFFAWVIPASDNHAKIGIGTSVGNNPQSALKNFLLAKKIKGEIIKYTYGIIPVGRPVHKLSNHSVLLVGDAALQTKSSSGGGLILGTMAGQYAAETVRDLCFQNLPLTLYAEKCQPIEKELYLHHKIAKFYQSLRDDQLNKIFKKIQKTDLIDYLQQNGNMDHPSLFIKKFKPGNLRYISLLPEFLKFSIQ